MERICVSCGVKTNPLTILHSILEVVSKRPVLEHPNRRFLEQKAMFVYEFTILEGTDTERTYFEVARRLRLLEYRPSVLAVPSELVRHLERESDYIMCVYRYSKTSVKLLSPSWVPPAPAWIVIVPPASESVDPFVSIVILAVSDPPPALTSGAFVGLS